MSAARALSPRRAGSPRLQPDRRGGARYSVVIPVRLRTADGVPLAAELSNISRTGFRSNSPITLAKGTRLFVHIDGYGPRRARVMWQIGEEIGCRFAQVLTPDQLTALTGVSNAD